MKRRDLLVSAPAAGVVAFCAYWAWAHLASPDSLVVLERRIRLPVLGIGIPAGGFFAAAPIAGAALFLWAWSRGRRGFLPAAAFAAASILNALRCLKLHDPALSYIAAGLAIAGTALTAWIRFGVRLFRRERAFTKNIPALAGIAAAAGLEAVILAFLVPWALRGSLPKKLEGYPFAPAIRRLVFADLAGLKRAPGPGLRSLRGIRLEGADLSGADLRGADLREARLHRARLNKADLDRADLRGAVLTEAALSFASLRDADLTDAILSGIYSMGADLRGATLKGMSRHVQRLLYADCRGADFSLATMDSAQYYGADFRDTDFHGSKLANAQLVWALFDGADLSGADLTKADFEEASLKDAILDGADLRGALHLAAESLAAVRSLRGVLLDPPLREALVLIGLGDRLEPE